MGIINLDAHFDLRDHAHVRSSGTPFSQIAEDCQKRSWLFQYACLGVSRSANTQALYKRAEALNVMVREDRDIHAAALAGLQQDVIALLEPLIETVRDSGKLRLADLAELNPAFDIDHRTARVAARLVHLLTLNG